MKKQFLKALAAAGCVAAVAVPASAQEGTAGHAEYMKACAACHGANGEGHGPIAGLLNTAPTDLTMLKQNNDGVFPFAETMMIVDGRNGIRAHGSEMPPWGDRFKAQTAGEGSDTAEINALGRIAALVYHLDSIQK